MHEFRIGMLTCAAAMVAAASMPDAALADRMEQRDIRNVQRPAAVPRNATRNNAGFFNFLDFSRSRRSDFGRYEPPAEDRVVRRAPVETFQVKFYTYKPQTYSILKAPGLALPLPDRAPETAASPAGTGERLAAEHKLDDSLAQMIYESLKSGLSDVKVTAAQAKAITEAYRGRTYGSLWTSMDGIEPSGRALIDTFSDAAAEGLDAQDYRVPVLAELGSIDAIEANLAAIARLDIELTALALRYASDASGGAIDPNRLSGYHDLNPPGVSPATAMTRLADAEDPASYLNSLHPSHPAYAKLRDELASAAVNVAEQDQPEPLPQGPLIRPGMSDDRIALIRARLITLGHLDAGDPQGQDASIEPIGQNLQSSGTAGAGAELAMSADTTDSTYDPALVKAVRSFQREAGLSPDALIGAQTIAAFNGDSEDIFDKAERIRLNMERLRWLPRDLGRRHIFVNQASYRLQVVDNGREVWQTKVIVGKPKHQTAFFSDTMETVVFNPYWGVPQSIIVNEMLPRLQSDPGYLDRNGYEVISSSGTKISSYNVDWWQYYDKVPLGVRQLPGSRNALGEVKFLFPNKHAIYLHDTPTKNLFSRNERAFSHGCVRVENPRDLARAVLGWDHGRIASAISTGRNTKVSLDRKFKVHLTYFTAWPDASGKIAFNRDMYDRDSHLAKAVAATRIARN